MSFFDQTPERERLQPALLDRLIDDEPDQSKEPPHKRVIDENRLRDSVKRDLAWLLGASNRSAAPWPERWIATSPELANSVLNFGITDIVGRAVASIEREQIVELERRVRQAILDFEPRLRRHSLRVTRLDPQGDSEATARIAGGRYLAFRIEGELQAYPVQLHLLLEAAVDVETGNAKIDDGGKAGI